MERLFDFKIYFCLLFALFASGSSARKIILDDNGDYSDDWIDISCHYSDDYSDFWVYGCPVCVPGDECSTSGNLPNSKGYWTTCEPKHCEIIFYAGITPPPKRIIITSLIKESLINSESPSIVVSQIVNFADPSQDSIIESILSTGQEEWFDYEIDLLKYPDTYAINITATPSSDGFVLIDKIIVDFGDDVPDITTTTEDPALADTAVLDLISDKSKTEDWIEDTCHYMDDYEDFWVYGCPAEPLQRQPATSAGGYWFPCRDESCQIHFFGVDHPKPRSIIISNYVNGDGLIIISAKSDIEDETFNQAIYVISSSSTSDVGWNEVQIDLSPFPNSFVFSIQVNSTSNGLALVDKIVMSSVPVSATTTTTPSTTTAAAVKNTATVAVIALSFACMIRLIDM